MKVLAEARDIVILGFALRHSELKRIVPNGLRIQTRSHNGNEHGFLTLGLLHYTEFHGKNLPLLSLEFSGSFLGVCITGYRDEPSYYVKRLFSSGLHRLLLQWLGGFPSRSMTLNFPTRAHPGGEYRWLLEGDGAGELVGKIQPDQSVAGRLLNLFSGPEEMVNFFWNRTSAYTGPIEKLKKIDIQVSRPEYHPILFETLELGFLSKDLERNTFPEAVLGSFFVPEASFTMNVFSGR